MNANIFKHEFRLHFRSAVTWSLSVTALLFVYISIFSTFAKDAAFVSEMMSAFPEELLTAFGMNGLDLSKILGFFSISFLLTQICLAIQASNYGFSLVSVEERELTADFLLTRPVGRTQILNSKFLAAFTSLTLTNLVVWIASFVFIEIFRGDHEYEARTLVLLLSSIVPFQLFFFTVGLVVSLLVRRIRSVTPYAMSLAFGMYVLSAFGGMLGESVLEKITPFKHFSANDIISNRAYDTPLVMVSVVVIVVSVASSYVLYNRRDIPSVT